MGELLEVEALVVRRGGRTVLHDATFQVGPGLWVLRGANGSGKSSLLRVLGGVLPSRGGHARVCGHDVVTEAAQARAQLCYVPEVAELFGYLTAQEFLETLAAFRAASVDPAVALFEQLTNPDAPSTRIASLSAGQRRKLLLSTMRCGEPQVLLLDEPTNALDQPALAWLVDELPRWRAQGRAVVVAMHGDPISLPWDGEIQIADGRARLST